MLLHGCETWTVQRGHEKKLQSFEIDVLEKGMYGVTGMYRVRNKVVRKAIGQEAVMGMMKEKQRRWKAKWNGIKWKGKLEQMSEDRLVKKGYVEEARGSRP